MKPSKKPKYRLDPKKFEPTETKKKRDKDLTGSDIFDEIRRSKPYKR